MGLRHRLPGQTYEDYKAMMELESSANAPTSESDSDHAETPSSTSQGSDISGTSNRVPHYRGGFEIISYPEGTNVSSNVDSLDLQSYDSTITTDSEGEEFMDDEEYFLEIYGRIQDIRNSLGTRRTTDDVDQYEGRTPSYIVSSELRALRHELASILAVLYRSLWNQLLAVGRLSENESDPRHQVTQRQFNNVILDLICIEFEHAHAVVGRISQNDEIDIQTALERLYGQPDLQIYANEIMNEAPMNVIGAFNTRSREMMRHLERRSPLNIRVIEDCDEIITEWLRPIWERPQLNLE